MKIGCSECLCIAIESHRSALLKSLLQRSDVQYCDIFWAPTPSPNSWQYIEDERDCKFPVLHDVGFDMDLSIIGRDDCGHMRVDVELCFPSAFFENVRAYILVSLPMIARWHTSERFNAERILRQSGKFDYSEPQFFDMQFSNIIRNGLPGPLNMPDEYLSFYTMCEYEIRNESRSVSLDSSTQVISLNEPSTLHCHMATARMFISSTQINFTKFYGQLSIVFFDYQNKMYRVEVLEQIQKVIECGGDLNNFLLSRQVIFASSTSYVKGDSFIWNTYRRLHCFDLFSTLRHMYYELLVPPEFFKCDNVGIRIAHRFTSFLLRNGLSFFYIFPMRNPEKIPVDWAWESDSANKSMLQPLFLQHPRMPESLLPFARGIAQQLLALGYGRRELHPAPLPLLDEHLDDTCRALALYQSEWKNELQSLVQLFRESPLSLQRLARIAVRRAVGGADFARQVRRLAGHIPLALVQYVADPTELMLSDEQVDCFVRSEM